MTLPPPGLAGLTPDLCAGLRFVLCDVDDTLTHDGRLPAAAFAALERLHAAGLTVIPVTGGAAGWCDMIARYWPVAAVIGESGAFYFAKHPRSGRVERRFWLDAAERQINRARLAQLGRAILATVPGCALAGDQPYRECDLAVDYAQDVDRLDPRAVDRVVAILNAAGARARVSSIHVNGWFGDYDKAPMALMALAELYGLAPDAAAAQAVFIGDAPNDAPMFACFPLSVGVANIRRFGAALPHAPRFITHAEGGHGFAELAHHILAARGDQPGMMRPLPA